MSALTYTVQPRGHLGLALPQGASVRIVDVRGQQVAHLVCYAASDPTEMFCAHVTRVMERRWLLSSGNRLWSNRATPMLAITDDSIGGHFSGGGYCSSWINVRRFGDPGAGNCHDNLLRASEDVGVRPCHVPGAFAPFLNYQWFPDGSTRLDPPRSGPGDALTLRAEMPLYLALSNCPQDRNACNGAQLTELEVTLTDAHG